MKGINMKIKKTLVALIYVFPVIALALILNFIFNIVPSSLEGLPIFLAPFICAIGIVLAATALKKSKSKSIVVGLVLNIVLALTPWIWMIGGTLIFGV
ncbi:hypothetical protein CN918_30725 [Priestia megaterium]|nr:hypothetical protein CN918_30725 [Priestia megaterium]